MKKPALLALVIATLVSLGYLRLRPSRSVPTPAPSVHPELPVNTIPLTERPFITLSPDNSGRNLLMRVSGAPTTGELEYELVYNATDKQEGIFGRLDLSSEQQPIEKVLLLGSKSGGGKVTYHEGVTGGGVTATYGDTKLKEQWNFLHFDPVSPSVTSSDVRFSATLAKTAFKKGQAIIVMKSFGLPAKTERRVIAGPYALLTPSLAQGDFEVSLTLPAGQYSDPQILAYDGEDWLPLKTTVNGDTLTAKVQHASVFIAVSN